MSQLSTTNATLKEHPSEAELLSFVEETLASPMQERLREHIRQCKECAQVLDGCQGLSVDEEEEEAAGDLGLSAPHPHLLTAAVAQTGMHSLPAAALCGQDLPDPAQGQFLCRWEAPDLVLYGFDLPGGFLLALYYPDRARFGGVCVGNLTREQTFERGWCGRLAGSVDGLLVEIEYDDELYSVRLMPIKPQQLSAGEQRDPGPTELVRSERFDTRQPAEQQKVSEPQRESSLHFLCLAAAPMECKPLDLAREWAALSQVLEKKFQQMWDSILSSWHSESARALPACRWAHLSAVKDWTVPLNDSRPHILYFSGHGAKESKLLLVPDEDKKTAPRPLRTIAKMLKQDRRMRLVIFNDCSANIPWETSEDSVSYVVRLWPECSERIATTFATSVYAALAEDRSLTDTMGPRKSPAQPPREVPDVPVKQASFSDMWKAPIRDPEPESRGPAPSRHFPRRETSEEPEVLNWSISVPGAWRTTGRVRIDKSALPTAGAAQLVPESVEFLSCSADA